MGGWKAVVFDLDGTLTDTLGDLAAATNEALQRRGFPACPLESYRHMVGNGARKLIERALGGACTPERTEQVLQDFLKIYDADCLRYTRPYDGVEEALAFFRAKGVRMAVVTNKPEKQARKIVRHFFGEELSPVYGGSPERRAKPDPGTVWQVLKELGVQREEALYVGDSDVDILTAKNAGVTGAGACWGFRGKEELRRAGADILLESPRDLIKTY